MRGFTLVELVLVLALLGVLATGVVIYAPPQSTLESALDSAAKQAQSDIEYARQNAMITGTTSGVQFVSEGDYTVYQGTTASPLKSPLNQQDMVVTLSTPYPGVSLSRNYTIEFNSLGRPTIGGGGYITLTNGIRTIRVNVTLYTGKISIQ